MSILAGMQSILIQVCLQPPTSAANVTLLASAADRRADVAFAFHQLKPTCRTAFRKAFQLLVQWPGTHSRILSRILRTAQTRLF